MFKYYKIYILIFCYSLFLASEVFAYNLKDSFKLPLSQTGYNAGYNLYQSSPEPIIGTVIQSILSFLGVIFLILTIYGGFLWMTAKGNEQQVEKAKNTLMAAGTGLAIVVAAYAISYFIISQFSEGALEKTSSSIEGAE